jgi:phage protein D/phage baseplate assembly protein gpV
VSVAGLSSVATIEIDGAELPAPLVGLVAEVVVDDHLYLPDTFQVTIADPDGSALGQSHVRIGSHLRVSAQSPTDAAPVLLIGGEVTSLEAEYDELGSTLVIRGYDHSHRLARGRHTETYNNVKYSDVARTIAGRASIDTGTIDDSGDVYDHVSQANQSDWDFLREKASEIDFIVAVVDGRLDFRRPSRAADAPADGDYGSSDPLQLVFGDGDLLEFRSRVSSAGQVGSVEVRGWSPDDKKAVIGTAQAGTTSAALEDDPASLSALFGSTKFVSTDRGPTDQPAADRLAGRFAELIGSTFADATALTNGNPHLRAGTAVSVSLVGPPFTGRYTLTHTRHVFDRRHGYRTQLSITGRQDRSLLGLTAGSSPGAGSPGTGPGVMAGVVIAIVDDVADPMNRGRVKLQFPWLSGDYVSDWARVAMPGAGAGRGTMWLPESGDEVLVAFEQGDVRRPVVLGGLWNGQDVPPSHQFDQGHLQARAFVSRLGHSVVLHDADGESSIELRSADGSLAVLLDQSNGEIAIKAAGSSKVTISAGGDLSLQAQGKLTLSGQQGAELTSPATTTVKGQVVQLNPPG